MVGLLYMASHYTSMGNKSVPPVVSRTSAPQQWHVPSRAAGLSAKMVDTVVIIMAGMAVFNVAGYLIEERRRWPVITASPRGQCSK